MSVAQGVRETIDLSYRELSLTCAVWKTLVLRPSTGIEDFEKLAEHQRFILSKQDRKLIGFLLNDRVQQEVDVNIVTPSVFELGLGDIASLGAIYQRAQEFGLQLCQKQVIAELALGFSSEVNGLVVATKLIRDKKYRFGHLAKMLRNGEDFPVIMDPYNIDEPIFHCRDRRFVFICPPR